MLRASLRKQLGSFRLDAEFEVPPGATLVLAGESGSGKTTALRLLGGLLSPDSSLISLDHVRWAGEGTWLAARERSIGYVPQDYALFPHLTVLQNVAFGLEATGWRKRDARERAVTLINRFGIGELGERRPGALSGGQQQRVALARALALEPRLLLLDEPLAALDLQTRREVRGELRQWLKESGCITVLVTHSPLEAIALGHQIAVLAHGRVVQSGTPENFLRYPRSPYVAEFMGLNLLRGRAAEGSAGNGMTIHTPVGRFVIVGPNENGDIFLAVSPREITLSLDPPVGSAQNVFRAQIGELIPEPPLGDRVRVLLRTTPSLVAEVTPEAIAGLGLKEGMDVYASFKATGVVTYI